MWGSCCTWLLRRHHPLQNSHSSSPQLQLSSYDYTHTHARMHTHTHTHRTLPHHHITQHKTSTHLSHHPTSVCLFSFQCPTKYVILIAVNSLYLYLVQWRVSSWSVGGGYRLVAGSAASSMAAHDVDTASYSRTYMRQGALLFDAARDVHSRYWLALLFPLCLPFPLSLPAHSPPLT